MSETLAEQLEALEAKATPGPWQFDGNCGGYIEEDGERIGRFYTFDDIPLIVALRNNLPTIIAALRAEAEATELREENARLREALEEVRACMLNGGDGGIGDFGWNISRLTKARPMIRAALGENTDAN